MPDAQSSPGTWHTFWGKVEEVTALDSHGEDHTFEIVRSHACDLDDSHDADCQCVCGDVLTSNHVGRDG